MAPSVGCSPCRRHFDLLWKQLIATEDALIEIFKFILANSSSGKVHASDNINSEKFLRRSDLAIIYFHGIT